MPSRREFLELTSLAAAGLAAPGITSPGSAPLGFIDIVRPPDRVLVQTAGADEVLSASSSGHWGGNAGIAVTTTVNNGALAVSLTSPSTAIRRIHLRWRGGFAGAPLILG